MCRHVSSSDKVGRRYRNMASVFTIGGDGDDEGNWSVSRSAGRPVNQLDGQSISSSVDQSINRSVGQPVDQSAGQLVGQSAGQLVSRSVGQSDNSGKFLLA